MQKALVRAVLLAASLSFVTVAAAKDAPAPDPKAVEAIKQLGLDEGATALRDLPGWRAPKRLVINMNGPVTANSKQSLDALQAAAPDLEIVMVGSVEEMIAQAGTADAIAGGDDSVCDERVLAAAKKLRWVSVYSAGVESCLGKKGLQKPGLVVTNMKAVLGPVMSEHTTALMFALSRSLQVSVARQGTAEWSGNFRGSEPQALTGKTLLVVGLGGIGTEVARRAHALGMNVIATRASSREGPDFVSHVGLSDELPTLITQADVVVSTLPLVPSTTRLFDAKMFARMKKTAFFINVGRGGSVVTDDLVAALNNGVIAGAGLDVTEPEPLPKDHPLWKAKNIIITPHMSARSDLGQAVRELILREQLRRFVAGDKLLSVVDLQKGY
ncbi:MAG TPA: D-2-hydroxyacid dehydrogenase [Steroidobacteraceae bacterium]|nr:D-2-hydroxyacid dehydrogenase [Steroidobacteraceae bacterium]